MYYACVYIYIYTYICIYIFVYMDVVALRAVYVSDTEIALATQLMEVYI